MSQNKDKVILNPFTGELQIQNDLELGWTVKNIAKAPFTVKSGYTRMYPNLSIPTGTTITVETGGELQVP